MPTALQLSLLVACAAASCSGPPTIEPTYEACATDENWITFDDYEKTGRMAGSGSLVPQWVAPLSGAAVPVAMPVILQWQPTAASAGTPDGDATCPQFQPAAQRRGTVQPLHLPPVSGTVYDLHLAIDGTDVYRVVTSRQRAGVPQNVFSGWSGKTVTATLYEAKMLVNSLVQGPYPSAPLPFQVTP